MHEFLYDQGDVYVDVGYGPYRWDQAERLMPPGWHRHFFPDIKTAYAFIADLEQHKRERGVCWMLDPEGPSCCVMLL